ncbi:MAG: cytidylate kinase-like family protein [Dehalococcoidia bacterium]|nr:cytidylate kinase-like family protein [Dehalococcoidia bacterium]
MPIITINGLQGSGALEIGPLVAQLSGMDYVDRLLLAEAGRRVGASVAALTEKEQRLPTVGERIARLFQRAMARSALTGTAGDPFFLPSLEALRASPYPETLHEPITLSQEMDDVRFVEVISEIIRDLAKESNVVILGRAANHVLRDWPDAFHVGIVAPLEFRVQTTMRREGITKKAAEKLVDEGERARASYFRRFYKSEPMDPLTYHMVINGGMLPSQTTARVIVEAAKAASKPVS